MTSPGGSLSAISFACPVVVANGNLLPTGSGDEGAAATTPVSNGWIPPAESGGEGAAVTAARGAAVEVSALAAVSETAWPASVMVWALDAAPALDASPHGRATSAVALALARWARWNDSEALRLRPLSIPTPRFQQTHRDLRYAESTNYMTLTTNNSWHRNQLKIETALTLSYMYIYIYIYI